MIHVLVADEPEVQEWARRALKDEPLWVSGAKNGVEILRKMRGTPSVDVLLLGYDMPGMERMTLAKEAKAINPKVSIVLLVNLAVPFLIHRGTIDGALVRYSPYGKLLEAVRNKRPQEVH